MKKNLDMGKIAIDNLDSNIRTIALGLRLERDIYLHESVLMEKLNLLYSMDIINMRTYDIYVKTIKALKGEN